MMKVMLGVIAVLVILLSGSGLLLRKAWHDTGILEAAVSEVTQQLANQVRVTADLKADYDEQNVRIGTMMAENNALQAQTDAAISTLTNYRDRLASAAQGRPGLVGRLATRATGRLMCQMAAATGGALCEN